jgi:hypothetical protein
MSRFKRLRGGALQATLPPDEIGLLQALPAELRPLYSGRGEGGGDGDPVHDRLFPRAYLDPTQEEAEREWQEMVHPELLRERLEALDQITASLERGADHRDKVRVELTAEEAQAWLGVLNDARLALGVSLGITEDIDMETLDPTDPNARRYLAYLWLTEIQGDLVQTLLV